MNKQNLSLSYMQNLKGMVIDIQKGGGLKRVNIFRPYYDWGSQQQNNFSVCMLKFLGQPMTEQ